MKAVGCLLLYFEKIDCNLEFIGPVQINIILKTYINFFGFYKKVSKGICCSDIYYNALNNYN